MLTVKLIDPTGYEIVKEIRTAFYVPYGERAHVTIINANPETSEDVTSGTVYVMNENGKTIADYFLGEPISE